MRLFGSSAQRGMAMALFQGRRAATGGESNAVHHGADRLWRPPGPLNDLQAAHVVQARAGDSDAAGPAGDTSVTSWP